MPSPTPPAGANQLTLLFDLWLLLHVASGVLDDALREDGLSGDDFGLYSLLRGFGPTTPSQIGRWTGMRPTTVSAALRRLTDRGHLQRAENPADGRSYLVGLSEAGRGVHAAAAASFRSIVAGVADALGGEEAEQRQSLQVLDAALRRVAELDARPYSLVLGPEARPRMVYAGPPLAAELEDDVRRHIEFVQRR